MTGRLKRLFPSFNKPRIDALLVSSWPNVTYLSGFKATESMILVSPKGLVFITDSRYVQQARDEARGFDIRLRDKKSVMDIIAHFMKTWRVRRLGFEAPIVSYSFYNALAKRVGKDKLVPTGNLVEALREIKDDTELALMRRSVGIAVKGLRYIREIARPGMKERDLQGRLEHYTKYLGSEKPAFDIIIAAGERASMPHCQSNETRLKNNDLVLVDMGVVVGGYHSDLTRPIFLGKMSPLHKKIFDIVWEAQRAGIRKAGPGVTCREVDKACRDFIEKRGYGKQFGHSTGHGVGLEVHESPVVSSRSDTVLKPGMVITVEPGVYLPGKFGIRIEDMVLITKNGNEVLTRDLDK
jgi:Xaa-Pro aminopeptidase